MLSVSLMKDYSASYLGNHKMTNDTGTAGGPKGWMWEATEASKEAWAVAFRASGMDMAGAEARLWGSQWQDQGQRIPVTKLAQLVKDMQIRSLEGTGLLSLPTKESEILGLWVGGEHPSGMRLRRSHSTEADSCRPVDQVQGICRPIDHSGHVGLGLKCSKKVAIAIRGCTIPAKLSPLCGEATRETRWASPAPSLAR